MKLYLFAVFLSFFLFSCENSNPTTNPSEIELKKPKNEVIVLGTIHGHHLTEEEFSITVLTQLIKDINPDYILTEIPPDRFPVAMEEFLKDDTITEARVSLFPEYVNVIFPLTKEMDFEIIPTAGWTKEMSDARNAKLKEISKDSTRIGEWKELNDAAQLSDSLIKATGKEFDPFWVNSSAYDSLVEIELSVYNRLFNNELGLGGWDNINEAHYSHISKALDKYTLQGKRILITYGAGHKGWFLKELNKRADIQVVGLKEAVTRR